MNSSGIKRGLALGAISALAVTGVPAIANAATLATQNGAGVELRSTDSGNVSVVNDGTNTTVSLVATADATVQFVTFSYGAGIVIGTTGPAANGEFQLEWTPPVGLANTTVTATATDAAGNALNPAGASDAEAVAISGTLSTVEINKPNGDTGYFAQPGAGGAYGANNDNVMAISGTTSDSNDTLAVTGLGVEAGSPAIAIPALPAGQTTQSFVGTVDVDAAALAGTPDRVLPVLTTDAGAGTADAQGFGLYAQQIGGISATQAPVLPNSQTTTVTVKVTDQNGAPVAGAHVVAEQGGADGFTNGSGEVAFANVPVGSRSYYADTTDEVGFQVGTDFRTSITVGASVPDSITYTSRDGDAFDIDEFDAGDSFINVKDSAGTNLPGQTFFYTWTFTPFETAVSGDSTQTTQEKSVVTNNNGNAVVPLPVTGDFAVAAQGEVTTLTTTGGTYTLNGYINRGTNPGQDPADLALAPQSIKVGESDVFFDGPTTTTRQLETNQDVVGRVRLFDGTALGGRTVSVTYAPGDDSVLAATQPAGTTRLSNTAATALTAADGTFTVSVNDPNKTPDLAENGTLSAVGTATVGSGANQENGIGTDAGTAAGVGYSTANDNVTIQFSADAAGRFITAAGPVEADLNNALGNGFTPGRPAQFTLSLSNSQNQGLAGQQVTLTTSNGFFTPNASNNSTDPSGLTADPASAEGAQVGEWRSLGDTITVTTDAAGNATFTVAIERDAGFDDDGRVTADITATSGTATNTNPISVTFLTTDAVEPLNSGSVEVVANDEANERNGIELPDARGANQVANSQAVRYDLFATDQFGNLVADQVNVADNTLDALINGSNAAQTVVSQFANDGSALQATATDETDQVITATWSQPSTVYTDGNAAQAGFQPSIIALNNTSETDATDAINWYLVDFAASTFSLTTEPEGDVAVGAPIVETVTVLDQLGKPVPGLQVAFVRQGPGDTSGDPNAALTTVTNANGQAFYAFTGTEQGIARVSAAVTDGTQVETLSDEITIIGNTGGGRVPVEALIAGDDNGGRKDVIRFQVDEAAEGATVRLFKIVGKGANRQTRQIRSDIVPAGGELTFKVADRNGGKVTRYVAKVSPTDGSLREKSNTQKIR